MFMSLEIRVNPQQLLVFQLEWLDEPLPIGWLMSNASVILIFSVVSWTS